MACTRNANKPNRPKRRCLSLSWFSRGSRTPSKANIRKQTVWTATYCVFGEWAIIAILRYEHLFPFLFHFLICLVENIWLGNTGNGGVPYDPFLGHTRRRSCGGRSVRFVNLEASLRLFCTGAFFHLKVSSGYEGTEGEKAQKQFITWKCGMGGKTGNRGPSLGRDPQKWGGECYSLRHMGIKCPGGLKSKPISRVENKNEIP